MSQNKTNFYQLGTILVIFFYLVSCTSYRPVVTNSDQIASFQFKENKRYQIVLINDKKIAAYGKGIQITGDQIIITTRFKRPPKTEQFPLSQVEQINIAKFSAGKTIGLAGGIIIGIGIIFTVVVINALRDLENDLSID